MAVEQRETTETIPATRVVKGACPHDCPDTCATLTEVRGRWPGGALQRRRRSIPSRRAGSAPRCAPTWSASTIPTGCNTRCGASARRATPTAGSGCPGTRPSARSPAAGRRSSPRYGAAAILPYSYSGTLGLLQLGVSNARLWNRMGASGLATLHLRRGGRGGGAAQRYGARWAPDYADVLRQPADHRSGATTPPRPARTSCRCCARRSAAAPTSS